MCDSRGVDLDTYLANYLVGDVDIHFGSFPGADLSRIRRETEEYLEQQPVDYTAIFAGICGFTERCNTVITYDEDRSVRDRKIVKATDDLEALRNRLHDRVNIATIAPACLSKFFTVKNPDEDIIPDFSNQQKALLEDIEAVNECIKESNRRYGVETLNIDEYVHVNSLKRRKSGNRRIYKRVKRFSNKGLWDGVHYEGENNLKILERIITILNNEIERIRPQVLESQQQGQTPPEAGTSQEQKEENQPSTSREVNYKGNTTESEHNTSQESIGSEITVSSTSSEDQYQDFKRMKSVVNKQ